jgi:cytochrome oxidase Cu insertion factor (SCO1/SenC/PrrC family)
MPALGVIRRLTLALLALALVLIALQLRTSSAVPDDFGPVGSFSFTSSTGGTVTERDLEGRITVFACFFTCCTEQCPALSGTVARLQKEFEFLPDVRLISLTVDPDTDTPEKLRAYAETFGARPDRWQFLTGDQPTVESFVIRHLKLAVEKNKGADVHAGNKLLHSDRLTVVDRSGRIRGWFPGTSADGVDEVIRVVRQLHGAK